MHGFSEGRSEKEIQMNYTVSRDVTTTDTLIQIRLNSIDGVEKWDEIFRILKEEIAKKFWEENQTQIMAKMDLTGLANLIAIEASGALKK
jgi:hypothetical protein